MLNISSADAYVIGSGPNGLSAAIVLARAGVKVVVIEASHQAGGGARSAELTLPGFTHDICSSVYPLGIGSPFFRTLPLAQYGLEWVQPDAPLAHPFDDGSVALLERSIDSTAAALGRDGPAYRELVSPLANNWEAVAGDLLAPLRWPEHPLALARFGLNAFRSVRGLAESRFRLPWAKALLGGISGHIMMPLDKTMTASFGIVLAAAGHALGWPFAKGGAQRITDALCSHLRALGGDIVTGIRVASLDELPPARAVLCDITPRQLLCIAGDKLPSGYRRQLERYRYGSGAFKVDWALSAPVPWRNPQCLRAGTLHLGGGIDEIAASERAAWEGKVPERPFMIFAQPSLFDPTRAPAGAHTAWAYGHVPHGCAEDITDRIEAQVERFAPGFRKTIVARSVLKPPELETHNANIIGGDINGGIATFRQMVARPTLRLYATPAKGLYLCSSSTPPGGGVHGMCGFFAATLALKEQF